ncbi:MAG TPA: arylsulfatase [Bryobacteraceae bacterium]|nr:arylsulfatase [Bryobacteraceae bacterium]
MDSISRRSLLRSAALGAAGAKALSAQENPAARPPNVVFILADDLGYADLGCYGQKKIRTPRIDAMAGQSLMFTQAYAGSTVCAPSRCCLMTGRHTGHATVRGNENPHVPLRPDEVTVANIFKNAGYATGQFGKWGLGTPPDYHALPTRKGFDEFFGYLHQVHAHTYFPDMLWDNEREHYYEKNFGGGKKIYSHDEISNRALAFLSKNHARPFFLYAPFTPPHGRFEVPDAAPYENTDWPTPAKNLAAMITRLDTSVGQILDALREHHLEENTLVIFASDNGPGEMSNRNFASSGSFRGVKRDLYEGGIRVPFLAYWKGRITPGKTDQPIAFWDFVPTICELLHATPPSDLDGVSFLPTLLGNAGAQKQHEYFYWEFFERGFQQALRIGDWKSVRLKPGAPLELYDLAADPGEHKNVAADNPAILRQMEERLRTCRTKTERWA